MPENGTSSPLPPLVPVARVPRLRAEPRVLAAASAVVADRNRRDDDDRRVTLAAVEKPARSAVAPVPLP